MRRLASHGENNQAGGPVDIVRDWGAGQVLGSGVYRLETKIYGGVQGCGGLMYNWVVTRGERGILDGGVGKLRGLFIGRS